MKKLLLFYCLLFHILCATEFHYSIASPHFELAYTEKDHAVSGELLEAAEVVYPQLCKDFQHTFSKKIHITLYPTIASHHQATGLHDAPEWVVARTKNGVIDIVSPLNPGPHHSKQTTKNILLLNIAKAFIHDKFAGASLPLWLVFGAASVKVGYPFSKLPQVLPSWEELETSDYKKFGFVRGYQCAHSFVSFLEKKYGWETVLRLLAEYTAFEKITGLSQKELYAQWMKITLIYGPIE